MKHLKKCAAFATAMLLCVSVLTSCGSDEESSLTSEPSGDKAALSGEVEILIPEESNIAALSELPGDYEVKKQDSEKISEAVKEGNFDLAVMTPIEAASLYNEDGGFKAVTAVSTGNWQLAKNNYMDGQFGQLTDISGYIIYGIEGDTMAEEALRALLAANNRNLYSGQVRVADEETFLAQAGYYNAISLATTDEIKKVTDENKEAKVIFDLASLWQENFKSDIPAYIIVASDSFIKERGDELATVIAYTTDYDDSNRGISLVKKFIKVMEKHNVNAIGGEVAEGFYFYQ